MALDDHQVRERVGRIETLLEGIDSLDDPAARTTAIETIQALLELYGEGLARVMEHAERAGVDVLIRSLVDDELVSHLLLLHGLHPVDLQTRVGRALEGIRPHLLAHGGEVELVSLSDGVARLRLNAAGTGCASSAGRLRAEAEEAVRAAAPELEHVEVDEVVSAPRPALIPVESLRVRAGLPSR